MNGATHGYQLFSETCPEREPGRWRFVLRATDGSRRLEADDIEPEVAGERLELLCVVRGLEALDQPAKVSLMTPSRYVREGIRYGVQEWRENGWCWESFGRMVPVKHRDLWQRVDRAMQFHQIECRRWRLDPPHVSAPVPALVGRDAPRAVEPTAVSASRRVPYWWIRRLVRIRRGFVRVRGRIREGVVLLWEALVPSPRFG